MDKTVLVIDDGITIREAVKMVLGESGFAVVEAENGRDALAKLDGRQIDIILCDVNMPEMDGISFLKNLLNDKSFEQYWTVPRIMLTTEAGHDMKEQGVQLGISDWMVKPFQPAQLIDVIESNLEAGSKESISGKKDSKNDQLNNLERKGKAVVYDRIKLFLDESKKNEVTVFAEGEMTVYDIEKVKKFFLKLFSEDKNILCDCSGIIKIDTAAVQLFMASRKYAKVKGGYFSLISPSNEVAELLKMYNE